MKKHIFIITGILVISTILNVSAFNSVKPTENHSTATTQNIEGKYILKDYNGQIALFLSEKEKPIEIFEIFTYSLPETDIAKIKTGIIVTESELEHILEEYTS